MGEAIWHVTRDGTPARPGAEGFVHASFTGQLAGTLATHYSDARRVVLLRLDEASLGSRLLVEPSRGGAPFPHVYGTIGAGDVRGTLELRRAPGQAFDLAPVAAAAGAAPVDPTSAPFLRLRPTAVARPWGGRRVAPRYGWADGGRAVGEWWLASSHPAALSGLADAPGTLAAFLDGPGRARRCPAAARFPLLVKLLDAEEILSLQVHPDDAVARRHGLPWGKTEAWHVLQAAPGAAVWLGTAQGVSGAELLRRIAAGADDDAVKEALRKVPLQAGDTVLVEAGTVHAIGPGLVLYELQQSSDATYRIHDWGRGRAVHLAEAADAILDHPPARVLRLAAQGGRWTVLLDEAAFRLSRGATSTSTPELPVVPRGPFAVLTLLAGQGELRAGPTRSSLRAGDSALLLGPAALCGDGLEALLAEPGP